MIKTFILSFFFVAQMTNTFAADAHDPALLIDSVEVQEISVPENIRYNLELPTAGQNPISEIIMYIDTLIAFGKKIWPIIEAGRPVLNTDGLIPSISILPRIDGETNRSELYRMANWSRPKTATYRIVFKNNLGNEVIAFNYTLFFQYNGSLNGVGKYITSLKVQASEIYAAWGFNFDAKSELVNVANVGSDADPVASGIITVSYVGKGIFNEIQSAQSFYVDGEGELHLLK